MFSTLLHTLLYITGIIRQIEPSPMNIVLWVQTYFTLHYLLFKPPLIPFTPISLPYIRTTQSVTILLSGILEKIIGDGRTLQRPVGADRMFWNVTEFGFYFTKLLQSNLLGFRLGTAETCFNHCFSTASA